MLVVVLVLENSDRFAIRLTEQISCKTSVSLRSRNPNAPFPKLQISKIGAKPIRARGELQKPQSPKAELTQAPKRASMERTAKRSRQRSEKLRPFRWPHSTGVRLVGGPGGDSC